ncbi:hypothetical protein COHA_009224 [Chlorella ohadii]|uniref:Arrestin C-terminal-like domain-containing protein n=1 Tax=Chlorella ohadii TaxID=2649997 RepID=A0AAD5DFT3_9CHLO|nr:hypothetical protein COHA_009224 [Chlorella ohadii]
MGGSFSKNNACFVQTDRPVYHDGEAVQAVVCLNLTEPVDVTDIECQLTGVESTYWTETRDHGAGSHHYSTTETHGGTMQMLDVKVQLPGGNRRIPPGQYQWPIVWALPAGLPSSFRVGSGGDGAEVTYQITVVLHTPGFFSKAIRAVQVLTVRQLMPAPAAIVDQSAQELQLVSCCCFNRGSVNAHVRVDKDRCQPGEEVTVILDLDNGRSKLPVDGIELSLKREAVAYERPGCSGGDTRRFFQELAKARHEGVPPFTATQRRMVMRLPADLQPSMQGALIRCVYFVKVKLNIGSFVKDVRLKVPIVVLAPQPAPTPEEPFFSEPPPFWHPSVVSTPQAIDVPSAPPLPPELLQPNAPFWARTLSNSGADGKSAAAAAAAAASVAAAAASNGTKYPVV